jgi:uncharacterized damage-inducible protein DinB
VQPDQLEQLGNALAGRYTIERELGRGLAPGTPAVPGVAQEDESGLMVLRLAGQPPSLRERLETLRAPDWSSSFQETTMRLVDPLIAELEQEAESTRRVLERIPEARLSWRPHPKSMSLGQLALHIATTPGGVARVAAQDTMEKPQFDRPEPKSKREVLEALEQSVASAMEFLRGLDDTRATQTWTMTSAGKPIFSLPRIGVVRTIMLNHWYHHRGEMQVYLRLLNVPVAPVYGPTADEDPFVASGAGALQAT